MRDARTSESSTTASMDSPSTGGSSRSATANSVIRGGADLLQRSFRFTRRWPLLSGSILILFVFVGITATWIVPQDPNAGILDDRFVPPIWSEDGSAKFPLGADHVGRDVLSRLIVGTRSSLIIATISLAAGAFLGVGLGLISGYLGGFIDELIMRTADIGAAFPLILLALALVAALGQSFLLLVIILIFWVWTAFARQIRGEALQTKEQDFVALARVAGASNRRIILRHILPATINTIIVLATLRVGLVIIVEASLSFLGAGVPPSIPTWGLMAAEGRQYLDSAWWVTFFPCMAIMAVVLALNYMGDWLRDSLDPRLRQL